MGEALMTRNQEKALVLLSGGVDSSTCLAIAASQGFSCFAMSFRYGQRNDLELSSASRVAQAFAVVEHRVVELGLDAIGGSVLTSEGEVPKSPDGLTPTSAKGAVPATYVPARNSIFLSVGAAWAEVLGTDHLFIGVNQVDFSGYPDCRPEFILAIQQALRLGMRRSSLIIHAPLQYLSKGEIIRWGVELGLDYGLTWSCYDPQHGLACGCCDSCVYRKNGFIQARIADPT